MALTGSFTETGTSAELEVKKADFSISGTFSGTIALQRYINGEWKTVASYTAPTTADDNTVVENGNRRRMRFECTAHSSGTINYSLGGP